MPLFYFRILKEKETLGTVTPTARAEPGQLHQSFTTPSTVERMNENNNKCSGSRSR